MARSSDSLEIYILLGLIFSILLTYAIGVPLAGTLVRFRANYTPKGLQLDGDGVVQPYTGPVVKSYFGMMARVKRLEGWSGLYKGIMPALLSTLMVVAFVSMLPGSELSHPGKYTSPVDGPLSRIAYSIFLLFISLPLTVITNRTITTPYKLSWYNAASSLRILLTPTERRRPWILYLTPGLLISQFIQVIYLNLFWDPIRSALFPVKSKDDPLNNFKSWRMGVFIVVVIISTLVMTPLEVISTRLSIQRNHAVGAPQEDLNVANGITYITDEEDVIGLRNEDDPYTGFMDCAQRMIQEEGCRALMRAWWLVMLPMMIAGPLAA